jgi:dipeptidyl aminopeptidase/acylaminoacyl peptidase
VSFEQLIFPDEIHGFLTLKRWIEAYDASARYIDKHLKPGHSDGVTQ